MLRLTNYPDIACNTAHCPYIQYILFTFIPIQFPVKMSWHEGDPMSAGHHWLTEPEPEVSVRAGDQRLPEPLYTALYCTVQQACEISPWNKVIIIISPGNQIDTPESAKNNLMWQWNEMFTIFSTTAMCRKFAVPGCQLKAKILPPLGRLQTQTTTSYQSNSHWRACW